MLLSASDPLGWLGCTIDERFTVEQVVGKKARVQEQPVPPGDVGRTWASLDKSRAELGYAPATSLPVGIAAQWRWYQTLT